MKHPARVWTDTSFAEEPLERLKSEWVRHLGGRARATSPRTIQKYKYSLEHFVKSLEAYGESVVLASLAPSNVDRWVTDQRKKGLAEDGISSRLAALKVFSNRFIFKHLESTTVGPSGHACAQSVGRVDQR